MVTDLNYIDEAATEAGIATLNRFAARADDLAHTLQRWAGDVGSGWQGDSYAAYQQRMQPIVLQLQHSAQAARAAAAQASAGLAQAVADEARAEQAAQQ